MFHLLKGKTLILNAQNISLKLLLCICVSFKISKKNIMFLNLIVFFFFFFFFTYFILFIFVVCIFSHLPLMILLHNKKLHQVLYFFLTFSKKIIPTRRRSFFFYLLLLLIPCDIFLILFSFLRCHNLHGLLCVRGCHLNVEQNTIICFIQKKDDVP